MLTCSMAAFALPDLEVQSGNVVFSLVLAAMMIPSFITAYTAVHDMEDPSWN